MKRCAGGPGLIFLSVHRRHADAETELLERGDPLPPAAEMQAVPQAPPRLASAMRSHHFVTWNGKPAAASASRTSNTPSGSSERAAAECALRRFHPFLPQLDATQIKVQRLRPPVP